jgi:hypothetical protein
MEEEAIRLKEEGTEVGVSVRGSGNIAEDNVFLCVCEALGWVSVTLH